MAENKKSPQDLVFENLEKDFGKNFIKKASQAVVKDVISTSYKDLDEAIGVGGLPLGIIVELFGPEASGKGVLSMHIISEAQKQGMKALWVDAENQFNKEWAALNGIDTDELLLMEPLTLSAEKILDAIKDLVEVKIPNIVVIDSLASLTPQAEIDKPMGEGQVGRMGAIMSTALRKLTPLASMNKCTIIFINQIREKIGVMFGNPETTPGGKSLGHYASLRLRIAKTSEKIEVDKGEGKEQIGINSKVTVKKNRFGMPYKTAVIPIYFEEYNPSPLEVFVNFARKCQAITTRTGTYYFGKLAGESPMEVMEIVVANDAVPEFLEKLKEKAKKKNVDWEEVYAETPDIKTIVDAMESGDFLIEAFN